MVKRNQNIIIVTGLVMFAVFLFLSILFYKERTCFIDISFHLFYILKDGDFAIQNGRFGAFFTQLFPLLGGASGISLKSIAILYSSSFVLLPLISFLTIVFALKNVRVATAYLLFLTLLSTHSFFWVQSELPQAMAFLFVWVALIDNVLTGRSQQDSNFWVISGILCFVVAFTHPLMLFPVTFYLLYSFLCYPESRKTILTTALMFGCYYIIKSLLFKTGYDSQSMSGLKNIVHLFPDYFNIQSNRDFLKYLVHEYYFLILFPVLIVLFYFRKRQYLKILLFLIFFTGYIFLINVSYANGAAQFYLENFYQVLAFFIAFPLVFDIFSTIQNKQIVVVIISLVFLICEFRIVQTQKFYAARLEWNRKVISNTEHSPHRKLILPITMVPKDTLMMSWASCYEFWLLSTIETGKSRSIIVEEKEAEFDWALPAKNQFITKWGVFEYSSLNPDYFVFHDSTGYVKLK